MVEAGRPRVAARPQEAVVAARPQEREAEVAARQPAQGVVVAAWGRAAARPQEAVVAARQPAVAAQRPEGAAAARLQETEGPPVVAAERPEGAEGAGVSPRVDSRCRSSVMWPH